MKPKKNKVGAVSAKLYAVERVCDRRVRRGKIEYFLKWEGYSESENTWEPEENLECQDLIRQYEEEKDEAEVSTSKKKKSEEPKKAKKSGGRKLKNDNETKSAGTKEKPADSTNPKTDTESVSEASSKQPELTGFDKGLEAESILGVTDANGSLSYFIKFKGVDEGELVPSSVVNIKIPQIVIQYYEERLSWYVYDEETSKKITSVFAAFD
uniref:Chromo domain-containing protein n=1 Tax=Glossina brevipalpis TaxID=37001 RepID=A0A1A9WYC0_9MUSC